ncbi:hypothetical protein [Halorubrum sp. Atlit-26R]|uniref:hypothetical protein n=1 Tax=Halorubrum sp. Atlit-26R TaxID=2282128 RepID=UPI0011C44628|nr:hypothetical protein [Halorubrum sp. Atlit-26R]
MYEGDNPYVAGRYVNIVADGDVVDRVYNEYDQWVTSSDQRTVTCSSAYVEWKANDNEAGAGPAVTFDVDWDVTPEVSKSVNVDVGSSTYEK